MVEACESCGKNLSRGERALFVEEEVGRIFCSEECITHHFAPEIERLEKDFFRRLSPNDLTGEERETLAHLRWITLQEPDEVWREKTLNGDHRYTLISEFQPDNRKIWSICICLFLRGEPSFLYLAFVTRNAAMVNHYRKGEHIDFATIAPKKARAKGTRKDRNEDESVEPARNARQRQGGGELVYENPDLEQQSQEKAEATEAGTTGDRLADQWTEDETFLAQSSDVRRSDDIQAEDFNLYQGCLEGTLQEPDEIWTLKGPGPKAPSVYHFIRRYQDNQDGTEFWYLIIARETLRGPDAPESEDDDDQEIEILDAFPTRDPEMVDRHRRGKSETGQEEMPAISRVVH